MESHMRFACRGLALVGGLFLVVSCSKGPSDREPKGEYDDLVLAKVGNKKVTVAELKDKLRYQFRAMSDQSGLAAKEQFREILRSAAEEQCWVTLGEKKGYDKDEAFRKTWEFSRRYILADRTIEHEVREKEAVSDAELQQYYDEHPDEFVMPARAQVAHVQVATRAEAERIRTRLLAGEPIARLSSQYTTDVIGKPQDGLIGWVTATSGAGHLGAEPAINAAAMKLATGGVSEPVQTSKGWSVVYCLEAQPSRQRDLDDSMKDALRKRLQTKRHNEIFKSVLDGLKKEYDFEIYEENYEKFARTLLSEDELFTAAERQKDPRKRASDYQAVVEQYPGSPRAAQAEFMVGFVLADEAKDYEAARKVFDAFLKKYPNHEMSASARWMLENMDKPDVDPGQVNQLRRRLAGQGR